MNHIEGFYFALWCEDKRSLQATRIRNIMADIDAGYSPFGNSIVQQLKELKKVQKDYVETFKWFSGMNVREIDEWCHQDLVKRGAISE